ncbi:cobalamin-dependent protein [Actinoplanes sp. NPDC023714]|uniref:cobalamin B12-binding domain-containing protein n=1 Tax=Actinoplanes sp. NPDC023714 TaxID=3154322 RepID=UPI0033F74491
MTGRTVLLSTVSSDSHTWNLVFLQLLLQEQGHRVVNLGPCVPDEQLVAAALDLRPHAIVISTVNGHGHLDGARLIRAVRAEPRLAATPAIIGGKLDTGGTAERHVRDLLDAGFDAVATGGGETSELTAFLAADRERAVAVAA